MKSVTLVDSVVHSDQTNSINRADVFKSSNESKIHSADSSRVLKRKASVKVGLPISTENLIQCLQNKNTSLSPPQISSRNERKTLVTYVYFENEQSQMNLDFFVKNGVVCDESDDCDVQYNFVIKGGKCSADIPSCKNIKIFKTANEGYDFGGYSYSIRSINTADFDYFIFINDSVVGPFVPRYIPKSEWYKHFVSLISDKVKLVGPSINRKPYQSVPKHVQSMAFATDAKGLGLLINASIFDLERNIDVMKRHGKWTFIQTFEVGMSGVILNNGYQIASFMQVENNNVELRHADVHFQNRYFNSTLNPIEIMFIKNNRIGGTTLQNYVAWNS